MKYPYKATPQNNPPPRQNMEEIYGELKRHGGWANWYKELESFRRAFVKYADFNQMRNKVFHEEHIEDGHSLGYFAPIDLKCTGYEDAIRTPAEQLYALSEQFRKNNVEFIYVALPCKAAIYPEMYVDKSVIPEDKIVIPQWRKVLWEAMCLGVNVVDMHSVFLQHKDSKELLFGESHMISPYAATIIGKTVANYLENFAGSIPKLDEDRFKLRQSTDSYKFDWMKNEKSRNVFEIYYDDAPYQTCFNDGEISVFGNCNSTAYKDIYSITAHIAYNSKRYINHVGRHLPFLPKYYYRDTTRALLPSSLYNKKIVIYVGFPSAAYVRTYTERYDTGIPLWNTLNLNTNIFKKTNDNDKKLAYEIESFMGNETHEGKQKQHMLLKKYIENSGLFDKEFYKETYISGKKIDPIKHYIRGAVLEDNLKAEWFPYSQMGIEPIEHYLLVGAARGNCPAPWFEPPYYLKQLENTANIINPFYHYLTEGREKNISPRVHMPEIAKNIMNHCSTPSIK